MFGFFKPALTADRNPAFGIIVQKFQRVLSNRLPGQDGNGEHPATVAGKKRHTPRLSLTSLVLPLLAPVALGLAGCGGGGGGGSDSGTDQLTISGTVSVDDSQQARPSPAPSTAATASRLVIDEPLAKTLARAHVNVCIADNNKLVPLPGHPTVLADPGGAFVVSVDKNDIPASRQLIVCAKEPTAGSYTVLAIIPQDLLPDDLDEVSTVTVNPDANTTIITRFACSQPVMLFNAGRCGRIESRKVAALSSAFTTFLDVNPQITVDLRAIDTTISQLSNDFTVFSELDNWRQLEAAGVTFQELVAGAENFDQPGIPDPQSTGVRVDNMSCAVTSNNDGSVTVTIAATGSGGGGGINVITNFFQRSDFSDLTAPDLVCSGGWQQSGGLATCSRGSFGNEFSSWVATYSFPTFVPPATVTSIVNGFASGSATVLATDSETVACQ